MTETRIRKSKIPALPANSSVMKKSVAIGIAIGIVLLITIFAIVFVPSREPLSLTFVQYQPWRQAAKLKLTNNSSKTIIYLTDQGGAAVLALPKTSAGWSNSLPEILTGTTTDAAGKTIPIYASAVPVFMTNGVLSHLKLLHCADLKPGESAELYVWFQVDGPPMRIGTVCLIPQGKLAQQFGRWINRVKRWCRMRSRMPGQIEVWCKEPLQLPLSPTDGTNHYDL